MTKETANTEVMTTEHAIELALQAERESLQVIAKCEDEAEKILSQARQLAHRINGRAENRVTRIHQRCKQAADEEINRLRHTSATTTNNGDDLQLDKQTVSRVVALLVESLTITGKATRDTDNTP